LSEKIKGALGTLSEGSLRYIINTHYHGDHTGGNENMSRDGAIIVAHDKVRDRLSTPFYSSMWDREVASVPESYWPKITFSEDISFDFFGEEIRVIYTPDAHTDGDAIVFFKTSNVIHTGDVFVRYGYPFIDVSAGGSIDGIIAAQELILSLANPDTRIIPGHGEISTITEVIELKQMLMETRDLVSDLKKEGMTLDEVLTKEPLAPYHERWNGSFIDTQLFTRLIYESLK
jgi:cyclase